MEALGLLLEARAQVNRANREGHTPLLAAAAGSLKNCDPMVTWNFAPLVAFLLLVAMPFAPSSFLLLVVRPLFLVAMPGAPSSVYLVW